MQLQQTGIDQHISLPLLLLALHTLSESAMKYMLASAVEISNAWGLLMASSAPLIDRQWLTCEEVQCAGQGQSCGRRAAAAAS